MKLLHIRYIDVSRCHEFQISKSFARKTVFVLCFHALDFGLIVNGLIFQVLVEGAE